jgi:hypothetical protein
MKPAKRRLPIPQWELGITPHTFNLFQKCTVDGERTTRQREQAERARQLADAAQNALFQIKM